MVAASMVPRDHIDVVSRLARESSDVLGGFFKGQFLVMIILGVMYGLGLWAVGLDLGILIGQPHARLAQPPRDRLADVRIDPVAVCHQEEPAEGQADLAIDRLGAIHQDVNGGVAHFQSLRREAQ